MVDRSSHARLERIVGGLLRYGTLAACASIAAGLLSGGAGSRGLEFGIVLLIAMPVLRVTLTTTVFLLTRDYLFAAISAAVLAIIVLGFLLGTGGIGVMPSLHSP